MPRRRRLPVVSDNPAPEAPADALTPTELAELRAERPRTRGDCLPGGINEARPCPWAGCRHHLYIEVDRRTGLVRVDDRDLADMPDTCSLDVADRGGLTLEEVGQILGLTRERIRQIEHRVLGRLGRGKGGQELGQFAGD